MIRKVFIFVIAFLELFTFKMWFLCRDFADMFHFSSLDARLKLEEAVRNDKGFSPLVARFYHNKVDFSISQVSSAYLRFWDIRFGVLFFSIVGYFGVFFGFWYLIKNNIKHKWIILVILLLIPFIEVFRLIPSYQLRLILLAVPYQIFSLYGLWQFIKVHKYRAVALLLILLLLSIWYQAVLQKDIFLNCFKM